MGVTGDVNGGPVKVGVALTDVCTGLVLQSAIGAALYSREKSGKGQHVCTSLLETQVACMINLASSYLNASTIPSRLGTAHASIVPYQAFQTRDGYIVIGAGNDIQFRNLCESLELPELLHNERYASNASRVRNREELLQKLQAKLSQMETQEVEHALSESGCPCGPVNRLDEVFENEQVQHLQMVHEMNGQKLMRAPVTFSETKTSLRKGAPMLGEHTREVLHEVLGYGDDTIDSLHDKKHIYCYEAS